MVVGIFVGVSVEVVMRVEVLGTSVGQLVPFCGVNVASGVMGMATEGSFWVRVVWSSHTSPLGRDFSESPYAKIGELVNIVVPFVIIVSAHVLPRDGAFFRKYGIEAVWASAAASSRLQAGVMVPITQAAASLLSGQMMPLPLVSVSACAMRLRSVSQSAVSSAVLLVRR